MATNNNGNLVDSSSNVAVDFVWGNFPLQPNDERYNSDYTTPVTTEVVAANAAQNYGWSGYSTKPAVRLNPSLDNHAVAEAGYAGFPAFVASGAKYMVTAASADGTTVTYTSQNNLNAGDTVTVTGLTTGAFNLASATVASATAVKFTVTDTATGTAVTGATGVATNVTNAAAEDGAYVSGTAYIKVPSVLGKTTALALDALKDAGYEAANITTASGASNAAKTATAISRTAGSTTITVTASSHAFVAGQNVTITNSGSSAANGAYTVLTASTHSFTASGTATTVLALTGLSANVNGTEGTIKTQSTAAGAASIASDATITITPWAAAS